MVNAAEASHAGSFLCPATFFSSTQFGSPLSLSGGGGAAP
jgi:hypothetical protein